MLAVWKVHSSAADEWRETVVRVQHSLQFILVITNNFQQHVRIEIDKQRKNKDSTNIILTYKT